MKTKHKIIFSSVLALTSLSVNAGSVNLQVRDVMTNISIDANVEVNKHKYHLNAFEPFQANLPNGTYSISITADGYKPMQTDIVIENNAPSEFKFMLDPQPSQKPPVKRQAMIDRNAVNVPTSNFYGYVVDNFGKPLAGVNVQAFESNLSTSTDERGYFSFDVPIPKNIENPTQTLIWSLPNYKTYKRTNVILMQDAQGYRIDLKKGQGEIQEQDHENNSKLLNQPESLIGSATVSTSHALLVGGTPDKPPFDKVRPFIAPPTSNQIRVGTECTSATNCKSIQTWSIEAYVATGLGSEWVPSWSANSLKAGAIAYRSYAVSKISGAKSKSFDICNTTACQVLDPKKMPTAAVSLAVQETAGFMLTHDGKKPYLSEYASKTNDNPYPKSQIFYSSNCESQYQKWKNENLKTASLPTNMPSFKDDKGNVCVKITKADHDTAIGCGGDGFSGEPKGKWWCLQDDVQKGLYHFGHGRGMSQVGSQEWAIKKNDNKDWSWILWHYYQEKRTPPALNTAKSDPTPYQEISSPIDTSKNPPTVDKTTASTGDTIKLNWKVTNTSPIYNWQDLSSTQLQGSKDELKNLLLKASLELGKTSTTLTNSDNVGLSIGKGEKELSSLFTIPSTIASGQYKIKLQLWLDVNKNSKVDEGDTNTDLLLGENSQLVIKVESTTTTTSCKSIKETNADASSGIYWLDLDGSGAGLPFQAYCDMTIDGGGWTLVGNFVSQGYTYGVSGWTSGNAVGSSIDMSQSFKLSDTTINALKTVAYRGHGTATRCYQGNCNVNTTLYWSASCNYTSSGLGSTCGNAYKDAALTQRTVNSDATACSWHWGLVSSDCTETTEMGISEMGTSHSGNHVFVGNSDSNIHAFDGRGGENPSVQFWVK